MALYTMGQSRSTLRRGKWSLDPYWKRGKRSLSRRSFAVIRYSDPTRLRWIQVPTMTSTSMSTSTKYTQEDQSIKGMELNITSQRDGLDSLEDISDRKTWYWNAHKSSSDQREKEEFCIIRVKMFRKRSTTSINVLARGILTHTHANQILARGHKKDKTKCRGCASSTDHSVDRSHSVFDINPALAQGGLDHVSMHHITSQSHVPHAPPCSPF